MDLHGRALLLLLSVLAAFGGNVTEDVTLDKIGKTLTVFNVVKFPNDPCTATTGYNGTCYTATECKTLEGVATGSCASSFGVCCVFSLSCGKTSSQNNTYIDQPTYTVGTDADPCGYKICSSGSVSKIKIEFNTLVLAPPAGDAAHADVDVASPFYTGHCNEDSLNIVSPGHASPPEICGYNSGQHMFIPMSDKCVMINLNLGTSSTTRSWSMKIIQFQAGNQMAPEGNCLQYHTASSGTFASFAWDLSTYGPGMTSGIAVYTQFHLANQHYNICFRREQGKTDICYTPKYKGSTTSGATSAGTFGLGGSAKSPNTHVVQNDGVIMAHSTPTPGAGTSACQGHTVWTQAAAINLGSARTSGDYLEIPHAKDSAISTTIMITRVCGNLFNVRNGPDPGVSAVAEHLTICSKVTPFRVGVHTDGIEAMGKTGSGGSATTGTADSWDNYLVSTATKMEGHGYQGFYLNYHQV